MPDISEFPGFSLQQWQDWFVETSRLILQSTAPAQVTIFYQSDIKHDGAWIDKAYLCQKAAELIGHRLMWHKIILRSPLGTTTFGRPAYSHMLCFSEKLNLDTQFSTPDVIDKDEQVWERGMNRSAALAAAKFIKERTTSSQIINPFCGHGTMLAAANQIGLSAIGIERSPKRAQIAQNLSFELS